MFEHGWQEAEATVIAVKELSNWSGDPNSAITQSTPHEYVVDVRPAGAAPFRTTFRDPYLRGHMDHPSEGQVIKVLCQPKAHKAKLIEDEWKHSSDAGQAAKQAEDERFDAARKAAAGGAAVAASDQVAARGEHLGRGEPTSVAFDAEVQRIRDPGR